MKKVLIFLLTLLLMTNKSATEFEPPADTIPVISTNITTPTITIASPSPDDDSRHLAPDSPTPSLTPNNISPGSVIATPSLTPGDNAFLPSPNAATPTPNNDVLLPPDTAIPSQNPDCGTFLPSPVPSATDIITLSFTGDCTIGSDESYKGNTFDKVYEKKGDPEYFFRCVKNVFEEDDFTFVNLEGTFTTATKKAEKEYRFKGKPSYCEILVKGSVEGVTLANNHTLDYLQQGFEDTVNTLNKAGILYTYFDTYFIIDIKGIQIGFLGYKGWSHEERSNNLLLQQVNDMREQGVDFIVANYHWGDMRSYTPNVLQKRMAYFAIDNGVDLVIGHHPHVIQGMETYKGKNIVYSLGNFCYGGSSNPSDKDTIIYQHIITVDTELGEIKNCSHNIIPALISSDSNRNNYQPIVAVGEEKSRIMEKFLKLSDELK